MVPRSLLTTGSEEWEELGGKETEREYREIEAQQ